MKKRIIFVLTAAMLFFSQVIFSSCGDDEEDEPVQNNSGKNNYTVSYSSDFGVAPQSLTVKEGDKLTSGDLKPLDTDGYIFLGWYIGSNQVKEGFVVQQDLKLVAKWEAKQILVSYSTQFGTAPNDISVKQGESLSSNALKELSYSGYEFLGWYDGDKKIECGFVVDQNIILTAKWKKTGIYVVDLNDFLQQQTDESKVYDVRILDLEPSVIAIIKALEAHPNIKVHLDLEECTGLKEVQIMIPPSGGGTWGSMRDDEPFPWDDNIDNVEDHVFLQNLVSLTLPNGVITVDLYLDSLTSLNIPYSVQEIQIDMENPPAIRNANTINPNCTINVPDSAIETYKNAEGWSVYADQIF